MSISGLFNVAVSRSRLNGVEYLTNKTQTSGKVSELNILKPQHRTLYRLEHLLQCNGGEHLH